MRRNTLSAFVMTLATAALAVSTASADPCGMVPPIYIGQGKPITRTGDQMTYVFHKDGIETFVIRPGFSGKVDQFGMLIPFPSPPAVRKVADDIFGHIAAAVDPPEVVIDLTLSRRNVFAAGGSTSARGALEMRRELGVRVISEEAVGMYQVAVLEAGSAAALKAWMDRHGYRYPDGMDTVCEEYVRERWCFVAVKTMVGAKGQVNPRPGMREADPTMPAGSTFDGHVQAMGFRFAVDRPVVPMRLSAFNEGDTRNIVYMLTDQPVRIMDIPEQHVVRQVSGATLLANLKSPLPLRIIGGKLTDVPAWQLDGLAGQRDPVPHNGLAAELFAGDLLAASTGQLSHAVEETEKELLRIGERLGLRGPAIDRLHHEALKGQMKSALDTALAGLEDMTLTVVDGDFPREVVARQNLTFTPYRMASGPNRPGVYHAAHKEPAPRGEGRVFRTVALSRIDDAASSEEGGPVAVVAGLAALGLASLLLIFRRRRLAMLLGVVTAAALVAPRADGGRTPETNVDQLLATARSSVSLPDRGWAIVRIVEIGGPRADHALTELIANPAAPPLVRTWAAAGRIELADSLEQLVKLAPLARGYPALQRPLQKRVIALAGVAGNAASVESLIAMLNTKPQFAFALLPAITAAGPDPLIDLILTSRDDSMRRNAASFLATLAATDQSVPGRYVDAVSFDVTRDGVPWQGGALFVPSLNWSRDDARALARELIAWHLWASRFDREDVQRQIHNNLQSVQLARQAGYTVPRGARTTGAWLRAWKDAAGLDAVREILAEQGVEDDPRYVRIVR